MRTSSLLSATAIVALLTSSSIAFADPVQTATTTTSNPNANEWALINMLNADVNAANAGLGVKVAVLDGLADCTHVELKTRCTNYKISGGVYTKSSDHGTHTSGIVAGSKYGVATRASILNYGVFDDKAWVATGTRLTSAWRDAATRGATISSMSFGCKSMALCFSSTELTTMADPNVKMLFVKAAGNDGTNFINERISISQSQANAAMARTLLVGSVDANGVISSFSNRPGETCLMYSGQTSCNNALKWKNFFLVAPGEAIVSAMPNQAYAYMWGTSMATPVVAGAAALLEARWPALKTAPEKTARILLTTATDKGAPGVDAVYGWGLLNVANAFKAQGNVVLVSSNGTATSVSGTSVSTGSTIGKTSLLLNGVTVYDEFGRDFTLGETGALRSRTNQIISSQIQGRRLLGLSSQTNWAQNMFSPSKNASSFASFGTLAFSGENYSLDNSMRAGVDVPFAYGVAQLRLTGSSDARLDFAFDANMRALSFFASSNLMNNSVLANANLRISDDSRLMIYGLSSVNTINPRQGSQFGANDNLNQNLIERLDYVQNSNELNQKGVGISYWKQSDNFVFGVNASMLTQRGGYYNLESNLGAFDKPTYVYNLGAALSHTIGDFELNASSEITHLIMSQSTDSIRFTPANLISAEIGMNFNNFFFASKDKQDSFALALVLPPQAISGNLVLDYMSPTADGLDWQATYNATPLAKLGSEPLHLEMAYRLISNDNWSLELSGTHNLSKSQYNGNGEILASFKIAY